MNKILLDKEKIINLNIEENSICNLNNRNDIEKININIKDGVSFIINDYCEINKKNINIRINQHNNSEFVYNHSYIVSDLYDLNININLNGNNSKNTININGINEVGKSNIIVNGKVNKNTIDNELYENIKILNLDGGKSNIVPNMFINTKNVLANHAASVTNINEDYLFYLNSKGIKNDEARKLIVDGFLSNDAKE